MRQTLPIEAYQVATEHTWESVRRGSVGLDWANRPNPFRSWEGSPLTVIPLPALPLAAPSSAVLGNWYGEPEGERHTFSLGSLGTLLFHSVAISGRKVGRRSGRGWFLRVNPSSGNLHPTETWMAVRSVEGLMDGIYHYRVDVHGLELIRGGQWLETVLRAAGRSADGISVVIVLTSIFWREAWKYRRRALRYCHLDAGHAAACIVGAARALGWQAVLVGHFADGQVAACLDCRKGQEEPLLLIALGSGAALEGAGRWEGDRGLPPIESSGATPSRVSPSTQLDQDMVSAFDSTKLAVPISAPAAVPDRGACAGGGHALVQLPAATTWAKPFGVAARARRSAVDHDPAAPLAPAAFASALHAALPQPPRDWAGWRMQEEPLSRRLIIPLVIIARVEGIRPGAYRVLADGRLELIEAGDFSRVAGYLSLEQEMAAHAAAVFTLVADLPRALAAHGGRGWRYAHFEAGFFGQGLYMAAAAGGFSATGIGAFYDDEVHRFWRVEPAREGRVVYHFALGGRAIAEPDVDLTAAEEELFSSRGRSLP